MCRAKGRPEDHFGCRAALDRTAEGGCPRASVAETRIEKSEEQTQEFCADAVFLLRAWQCLGEKEVGWSGSLTQAHLRRDSPKDQRCQMRRHSADDVGDHSSGRRTRPCT